MSAFGNLSGLGEAAAVHRRQAHNVRQDFVGNAQDALAELERGECKYALESLLAAAQDFGIYQREAFYATESDTSWGVEATGTARLYERAKAAVFKACIRK